MRKSNERILKGLAALLAVFTAVSCVDEKIVERIVEVERELFQTPSESAAGMLGYTDIETKLTVCGNCHVGPQSKWATTAHADAWEGLQSSGHAQELCEGCHTVNELGNTLTDPAGFNATGEDRYHDVQCESCHGPGLEHVSAPEDANIPLAPIATGLDNTQGCGECHQGAHHPFVEQWENSAHGTLNAYPASNPSCAGCHEAGGILARWGETAPYLEEGELQPQTCAVCHDPHGSDNPAQLRFPIGGVEIEQNLCSQCHNRRTVPEGGSHGLYPHSPETALLNGEAGFFFPGSGIDLEPGRIIASHGSAGNERLCATCHVVFTTINDAATGEFLFESVGHGFNAIPCLDQDGIPTSGDCELSTATRSFEGCTGAGCHTSVDGVSAALSTATSRFQDQVSTLRDLLLQVDPNLDGPGGPIDANVATITTAEGAFFNMQLAAFGGPNRPSEALTYAGAAAHNPFLVEQLLRASINAVVADYNLSPPVGLDMGLVLGKSHN